jgi:cell division protein FtsI/penicillin-binding protein 2
VPAPTFRRHRSRSTAGRVAALAALVVVAATAAGILLVRESGPPAGDAAKAYAAAWSAGRDAEAARLTDAPRAAAEALGASRRGLDGARVRATVGAAKEDGDSATAPVDVVWEVPGVGRFAYGARLRLARAGERWLVRWSPQAVHPRLKAGTRLGTAAEARPRGRILARDGRAIVRPRDVVDVAVQVDRVKDPDETAQGLAALDGLDVDAAALARRIREAPRGRFLPLITLRSAAYERIAGALGDDPGASVNPRTAPLAPTKTFARALLGTVGPVTAEQLRENPDLAPGAEIGQSGLQAAYERRLASSPAGRVVIRDIDSGVAQETLLERPGRRGRALRTTLDLEVQAAAETALGGIGGNAALVAVQPSTGDVLAVANRPADSAYDRALAGLYPPGSTFKVVSMAALLRAGLDPDRTVDCPRTLAVEGKPFRNFEGDAAGAVPFRRDFAQSCNTAFVSLAGELGDRALTDTARDFGLGRKLDSGLPAAEAAVPPPESAVGKAAMMIGQDRIVASPLAMAGVAATVAAGRWHAPRLVEDAPEASGPALAAGERDTLRSLMRDVVASGTGTALAGVPGEVLGKSGTAEYGGGDPPPTHAWFIAARDDLALAVLVEGGEAGGSVAAPIAARFFAALDGG